jgi:phosphoribosyl 1,2-cyclic phosphate phosphodiesterase
VAAVIEGDDGQRILIDTPPELRLQLLREGVDQIDAVLYTHDHADHVHGIDDLRALSIRRGQLPIYGPADTLERIVQRFSYIFDSTVQPPPGTCKPELTATPLAPDREVTIAGIPVMPLAFEHGSMAVFGYRFGAIGYVTDVKAVSEDHITQLRGVRALVLNALFEQPHPTHMSIPEAIEVAQAVGAERTFLTHLTHRSGYQDLAARLPTGIEPAYDGLAVSL